MCYIMNGTKPLSTFKVKFWKIIKYRKWDQLQQVLKVTDGGCNWLIAIEGQYWYYSENSEV